MIITGPAKAGKYPYRIEGHSANAGIPLTPAPSEAPLFDACIALKSIGEPPDRLVGLFGEGEPRNWLMRTSVGYGARHVKDERNRRLTQGSSLARGYSPVGSPGRALSGQAPSDQPTTETSPTGGGATFTGPMDAGVPTGEPIDQGGVEYNKEFREWGEHALGTYPLDLSGEQPAKPAGPPQHPRKPPAPPADTGPAVAPPAKSGKSRRRPKRAKSGGRRAASRAR